MNIYFGDIHNHCGISYGHGSLENAYQNARLQLDFASVTGHSSWPDMPEQEERLQPVVEYHTMGFEKLAKNWESYVQTTQAHNEPGKFITLFSYEWHSGQYGDYVVYLKDPVDSMLKPQTLEEFRQQLLAYQAQGIPCMLVPHHIGYKTGYRGINWNAFFEDVTPIVEIMSMHGCAECDESPIPYLHTMGPLTAANTMQSGLAAGRHFGVIGSTDNHSAHPGDYGYGRAGVWAEALTRDAIWEALQQRRTYALSGDKIELDFTINGHPLGSRLPYTAQRHIAVNVKGGYALDRIEILKNATVIFHKSFVEKGHLSSPVKGKVVLEFGWGDKDLEQPWEIELAVENGELIGVEPRLHGLGVIVPADRHQQRYQFSDWARPHSNSVVLHTCTWGNPNTVTNANQSICLEIEGKPATKLVGKMNGVPFSYALADLHQGSQSAYLGGFLTGAARLHRFMPEQEYSWRTEFSDESEHSENDFYYVRVSQKNQQWAWSSPVKFF